MQKRAVDTATFNERRFPKRVRCLSLCHMGSTIPEVLLGAMASIRIKAMVFATRGVSELFFAQRNIDSKDIPRPRTLRSSRLAKCVLAKCPQVFHNDVPIASNS